VENVPLGNLFRANTTGEEAIIEERSGIIFQKRLPLMKAIADALHQSLRHKNADGGDTTHLFSQNPHSDIV
jgi:hypothetical protein